MFDPNDPLPPAEDTGLSLTFELVATLPATATSGAVARIQQVVPVPGGDGALVALDDRGVVWLIGEDGAVRDAPLLDLRSGPLAAASGFQDAGFEAGLRSIAFHPDFATEGAEGYAKLYVGYSASASSRPDGTRLFEAGGRDALFQDVVAELTVGDPSRPVVEPGSLRELFRVEQAFSNHNLGQLAFDPDLAPDEDGYGDLFVSLGDGGGSFDPLGAAGDLSQVYGKVLRIDPIVADAAYGLAAGNPFAGTQGALGEVFAYGFRNPQAMSFDDGQLIASDIGQNTIEEVNAVIAGGHYGWNEREGTFALDDLAITELGPDDGDLGYHYPLVQYDHEEIGSNAAVAGGFVYGGTSVVALEGVYLFGDFPSGRVFAAEADGFADATADGIVTPDETAQALRVTILGPDGEETSFAEVAGSESGRVDLRFGQTAEGEILVFSKQTGEVFQLTSTTPGEIFRGTEGADLLEGGAGDDLLIGDYGLA